MSSQSIATLARWHREHHARRELSTTGGQAEVARFNLRALGKAETSEAVEAEVRRLEDCNRMALGTRMR